MRGGVGCFAVFAMIDEGPDGNSCCELWSATDVVVVIVGDKDEVNFVDAAVVCGGDDAIGVTIVVAGPAGVDQQGLSFWSDE